MEINNKNKILSLFLKILYYIVIVFVCLIAGFLVYYIVTSQINQNNEDYHPKISIYTIVSPSMTPTINVYDIVVNAREDNPDDIQVGDIITYISKAPNSEGMTITHRVVQIAQLPDGEYEYMTQGDNNSEPDSLYVMYDQVIGKKILIIPKVGKLQFLISEKKGWLFLLLIPVSIYIFIDVYKLIKLIKLKNKVDDITEKEVVAPKNENVKKEKKVESHPEQKIISKKHESFLEKYEETIVEVKRNKYTTNKDDVDLETEPLISDDSSIMDVMEIFEKKTEEKEKIDEKPKNKKVKTTVVNEQYEILDTDELSSKIKEYDDKIAELDKMLQDMDNLKNTKAQSKSTKKVEKENVPSFLKENKIKVVSEEETKNKKRSKKVYVRETTKKDEPKPRKVEVTLKPVVEKQISDKVQNKKKNQNRLNLNPNDIKTIKRSSKAKLPIDEMVETKSKKQKKTKTKRKSLISIEKVR